VPPDFSEGLQSLTGKNAARTFSGHYNEKGERNTMKVCFPVIANHGLQSTVYGHFASAPLFLEVDTDSGEASAIPNCDKFNPDAGCNPFKALTGRQLDGVVVGGVGDTLLDMLNMMGFRVYEAQTESVQENIELFGRQELPEVKRQNSAEAGMCGDGCGDGSCNHDHRHEDEEDVLSH
jgi:predicted Fe-Mo cluster-binding NifX family protein